MKKVLLFLGISLIIASEVQAVSRSDINTALAQTTNELRMDALHPRVSITRQQQVLTNWDAAVKNAKQFVIDNSKDLLRKEDKDLIGDLSKVESLNNNFTNIIKILRGTKGSMTAPISKLLQVATEAKKLMEQLQSRSYTLSSKKDANIVLIFIADCIQGSAKYLYDDFGK